MAKETINPHPVPLMSIQPLRPCYMFSGGATTVDFLLTTSKEGGFNGVTPACAIASTESAGGLKLFEGKKAKHRDVPHAIIDPKKFGSSAEFGEAIIDYCEAHQVNFVGQYGWMPWTPKNVITRYKKRMTNQHPGPVRPGKPDFGGKKMHGIRVHAARLWFVQETQRDFWTEATSQEVDIEYDLGQVIIGRRVDVDPANDTPETLRDRVLPVEWQVQKETLQMFADGNVTFSNDRRTLIHDHEMAIWERCKQRAIETYK